MDGEPHRVLMPGVRAVHVDPGLLLRVSAGGELFAAPFDVDALDVTAPATLIADGVDVGLVGTMSFAASESGILLYGPERAPLESEIVIVSRDGSSRSVDPSFIADFRTISVSGDGSRVAMQVGYGIPEIWIRSLERGTTIPLRTDGAVYRPMWGPADSHVQFTLSGDNFDVWRAAADGTGEPELLLDREIGIVEARWSHDDRWLLYRYDGFTGIRALDTERDEDHLILDVDSTVSELNPTLSADGTRLAYVTNETDEWEVYVVPFPGGEGRAKVSEGGGQEPLWSRDGTELFYKDADGYLVVVDFARGDLLDHSPPRQLFSVAPFLNETFARPYDVMPGDSTFAMIRTPSLDPITHLVVIEGFTELLNR